MPSRGPTPVGQSLLWALQTLVLCDPDLPEAEIGPRNAIGSETRFVRSIDEIPEAIHGLLLGLKKRDAF